MVCPSWYLLSKLHCTSICMYLCMYVCTIHIGGMCIHTQICTYVRTCTYIHFYCSYVNSMVVAAHFVKHIVYFCNWWDVSHTM